MLILNEIYLLITKFIAYAQAFSETFWQGYEKPKHQQQERRFSVI